MGRVCREIQEWVEEQIEQPIEEWENQQKVALPRGGVQLVGVVPEQAGVLARVGRREGSPLGGRDSGEWVGPRRVRGCERRARRIGFVVNLILSIPIIGGIIRTILNWITEIIWRIVGLIDFVGSLIGIRLRKKMYSA